MNIKAKAIAALQNQQLSEIKELTGVINGAGPNRRVFVMDVSRLTPEQTIEVVRRWRERMAPTRIAVEYVDPR